MTFVKQQAGQQMTLSAIAYVDNKDSLAAIKTALKAELVKTHYATAGLWELCWGPVIHGFGDNLMYMARHKQSGDYSLVLRGTVPKFGSFWEDVPTEQSAFPYIEAIPTKVSSHFLTAQKALLDVQDPDSQQNLAMYLHDVLARQQSPVTFYVTGHSQGAGLVPMFVAWFIQQLQKSQAIQHPVLGYAFAPPTSGDPDFAHWISEHATSFQVTNPLDIVPFGYAGIKDIIQQEIPEKVPKDYHLAIDAALATAKHAGQWQQPQQIIKLDAVQLPSSIEYFQQILDQHNTNSYLYLLGATQTDLGKPSVLPDYAA